MVDSVRIRLTSWYSSVLALTLIAVAALSYFLYSRSVSRRTDASMAELWQSFASTFVAETKNETGPDALKAAAHIAMEEHRFADSVFAIVDANGGMLMSSLDLAAAGSSTQAILPEVFVSHGFRQLITAASSARTIRTIAVHKGRVRAFARPLIVSGQTVTIVLLQSLRSQSEMLEGIRNTLLWIVPIAILFASAGGYFLARKSLAPVVAMAQQARNISAANLHDRLSVANERDELGQLAFSFNQLLGRLENSFEQQRQFISDASHELRTPVAILHGEAEVTLAKSERSPDEYRESLGILRDESQRLTHIIEDLFTLTRADAGQYPLSLRNFYLDELVADVCRHARSLAIAKGITLSCSSDTDLPVSADEVLLRRMLFNLVDNAIKYSHEDGQVCLQCRKQENDYILSVTNSGAEIPESIRHRIFERFFRADKARSRSDSDTGGAGLGLSIARWIAEAHHGRLELTRSDSSGTTFTAYLPIAST